MVRSFCIDIGGSKIKHAFVVGKSIKDYSEIKTPKNKSQFLDCLTSLITTKTLEQDNICISIASPIKNNIIQNPPNLPIKQFNLIEYLQKNKIKNNIYIENDARCVALAEHKINKSDNFVVLTFGTGIGGAIVLSGKLYKGLGFAGELGHIMIKGKYLEDIWKKKKHNVEYLSQAIISIQNSIDPKKIIFSSRVIKDKSQFMDAIKKHFHEHKFNKSYPELVWSKIEYPELIGAGVLPHI